MKSLNPIKNGCIDQFCVNYKSTFLTVKTCGDVPSIDNGLYNPDGNNPGDIANIVCNVDYKPDSDDAVIVCELPIDEETPRWSEPDSCIRKRNCLPLS